MVDALLAEINASDFRPGQSVSLAPVSNAVEVTRDLVTVNLGTSARALGSEALFALRMAITNTLTHIMEGLPTDCTVCQLKDICDEVEGMKELHFGVGDKGTNAKDHH